MWIEGTEKTYLMRGDSVRFAGAKGLKREERTQMGRWENGAMDVHCPLKLCVLWLVFRTNIPTTKSTVI